MSIDGVFYLLHMDEVGVAIIAYKNIRQIEDEKELPKTPDGR